MRYEVGRLLLIPLVSSLMAVVFLLPSCTQPPPKPAERTIIWDHAGSWSGRGNLETNSFPASSGYLRFTWETSNETKPGEGRFKLILGSSISGRLIQVVVDSQGATRDVSYVSEEPRTFYLKVESANEDWKVTVDEGFSATIEPKH
jgi:outer membrane biogenesis lipoprotein LolB